MSWHVSPFEEWPVTLFRRATLVFLPFVQIPLEFTKECREGLWPLRILTRLPNSSSSVSESEQPRSFRTFFFTSFFTTLAIALSGCMQLLVIKGKNLTGALQWYVGRFNGDTIMIICVEQSYSIDLLYWSTMKNYNKERWITDELITPPRYSRGYL